METKITLEDLNEQVNEYLKSSDCKKQLKECIIDFLTIEDGEGYFETDGLTKSLLNEDDWKDIAKSVGEEITVVGNMVFTRQGIVTSGLWNKYKA